VELAEDTTSNKSVTLTEDAATGEKERILSVMPAPGEKFHGLAKNFFGPPQATVVFPPPIGLRIETGVL
jgi:hypothetical protein